MSLRWADCTGSRARHPLAPPWVPLPSLENRGCLFWVCFRHNAWVDNDDMFCVYDGGGMSLGFAQMLQLPCVSGYFAGW